MSNYQTFVLPPNFSFALRYSAEELKLSDVTMQGIEKIWRLEKEKRQEQLFNGKVLSLIEHNQEGLLAEFIEYKRFLAYVLEPSLRKDLSINPLSLSCITHTSMAFLFGRRSQAVLQYPLWFELAPSGGIDAESAEGERIDIAGQALRELKEETGYSSTAVQQLNPFALVYDSSTGIYEICIEIMIKPETDQQRLAPTQEYDILTWVAKDELPLFIQQNEKKIVPLSLHLLKGNMQKERCNNEV